MTDPHPTDLVGLPPPPAPRWNAETIKLAREWLKEMVADARLYEPDVGIFSNEDLASLLEHISNNLEEIAK